MSISSGPPVLNPVYGPTAAPKLPTSSIPPPCKAAPNPVYAETGAQIPDVSALNPVYSPVGKPGEQPPVYDQSIPRYTNTLSKGETGASNSYDQVPNVKIADPLPMYEELQITNASSVSNQVGDTMTKNVSYGLVGNIPSQPSTQTMEQ